MTASVSLKRLAQLRKGLVDTACFELRAAQDAYDSQQATLAAYLGPNTPRDAAALAMWQAARDVGYARLPVLARALQQKADNVQIARRQQRQIEILLEKQQQRANEQAVQQDRRAADDWLQAKQSRGDP